MGWDRIFNKLKVTTLKRRKYMCIYFGLIKMVYVCIIFSIKFLKPIIIKFNFISDESLKSLDLIV